MSEQTMDGYTKKIGEMAQDFIKWRQANPDSKPIITYNIPPRVMVAGTVQDAIEHKFLQLDNEGRRMFQELGWLDNDTMAPSVTMTRFAVELVLDGHIK